MTTTTPKLKKGMKAFAYVEGEKFFHLQSTMRPPMWSRHADAFKEMADLALDRHEADVHGHNDKLLYPVLYNYRHCLELKLKDILLLGVRCNDIALDDVHDLLGEHPLWPLWVNAKQFLAKHHAGDENLRVIEKVIQEFHQIDRDGQTLRYDRRKDLKKRTYDRLPKYISVGNLRKTMDAVYSRLVFMYAGIEDWWDAGRDC
jgi:hypothetical protein